jgi:hypothetical protein
MESGRKHGHVIERYASDLFVECWDVAVEILEKTETEGRLATASESRELKLLVKISLLLCDIKDLDGKQRLN